MSTDDSSPPAAGEPELPHLYGLALFEYDLVAQMAPGLFLLFSLRILCAALSIPQRTWNFSLPPWGDWWTGLVVVGAIVLVAYIIGLLTDALIGWRVAEKFAKKAHKRMGRSESWKTLVRLYTQYVTTKNEYIQVYRAHTQARALANMGVLCIALTLGMLVAAVYHDKPCWMLCLLGLGGALSGTALLYASYWRERRRVWGVHLVREMNPNRKCEENAQKCGKPSCWHWVISGFALMIVVALIVLLHVGPPSSP